MFLPSQCQLRVSVHCSPQIHQPPLVCAAKVSKNVLPNQLLSWGRAAKVTWKPSRGAVWKPLCGFDGPRSSPSHLKSVVRGDVYRPSAVVLRLLRSRCTHCSSPRGGNDSTKIEVIIQSTSFVSHKLSLRQLFMHSVT